MKISQLYGKIAKENGSKKSGYVIRVFTSEGKISALLCVDENEREFYLYTKDICVKGGCVLTDGSERTEKGNALLMGAPCYTPSGSFLGILREVNCKGVEILTARIGNKNYGAENLAFGDAVIVAFDEPTLKSDVIKDGEVIFKEGEPVNKNLMARAIKMGEYVQTNLKALN